MKKLLLGAVALTMLATACKKDDDNGTPGNTFTIDGTSYTTVANGVNVVLGDVSAAGTNGTSGGSLVFSFSTTTTPAAGTYRVVADTATVGANQVSFTASSTVGSTAKTYQSTGAGTVDAVVTVNGGKVSISMPDAPATVTTGGSGTVNVKANISQ